MNFFQIGQLFNIPPIHLQIGIMEINQRKVLYDTLIFKITELCMTWLLLPLWCVFHSGKTGVKPTKYLTSITDD